MGGALGPLQIWLNLKVDILIARARLAAFMPAMNTTRRSFLRNTAAATAGMAAAAGAPAAHPNIILILADDMGFSDIGCYGSEIDTPNLDRLASQGVRFTQFYNCARCCPSRSSLLTGLYPHQAGIGHMVDMAGPVPAYADDLSPRSRTIAQVLKGAGYQMGMVGKWHVTPVAPSRGNWPLQRRFDRYYGIIHGAADYFNPVTLTSGNDPAAPDSPDYYFTDAVGDRAVQFVDEFSRKPDPFFLYAAFTAPHWPLHARPDDIRKYEGRYRDGWDAMRQWRHENQLRSGMLSKRWDLTQRDERVPGWKDAPDKGWEARRMEVYAAMVDRLDQNVGRILTKLQETGRADHARAVHVGQRRLRRRGPAGMEGSPHPGPNARWTRGPGGQQSRPDPRTPIRATGLRGRTRATLRSAFTSAGFTRAEFPLL